MAAHFLSPRTILTRAMTVNTHTVHNVKQRYDFQCEDAHSRPCGGKYKQHRHCREASIMSDYSRRLPAFLFAHCHNHYHNTWGERWLNYTRKKRRPTKGLGPLRVGVLKHSLKTTFPNKYDKHTLLIRLFKVHWRSRSRDSFLFTSAGV